MLERHVRLRPQHAVHLQPLNGAVAVCNMPAHRPHLQRSWSCRLPMQASSSLEAVQMAGRLLLPIGKGDAGAGVLPQHLHGFGSECLDEKVSKDLPSMIIFRECRFGR